MQQRDHRPEIADPGLAADAFSSANLTSGVTKTHDLDAIELVEAGWALCSHMRAA